MVKYIVLLLLFFGTALSAASIVPQDSTILNRVDQTLEPRQSGRDVVLAAAHKIQLARIFPEDDRFLVRVAWVETAFGTNNNTYNPPNQGGIWKVSTQFLVRTQSPGTHPVLVQLHARILAVFGTDWMTVVPEELEKPLYSGLAARLYLATLPAAIPVLINDQAQFWKEHYNDDADKVPATYINAVTAMEQVYSCNGKLDLIMVLDGSESMRPYFDQAKGFLASLVSVFSLEHIHIGFFVYDSQEQVHQIFPLANSLSSAEMVAAVQAVLMPGNEAPTAERPDLGIRTGIQQLRNSVFREGAPQVIATFYDGGGNGEYLQAAVNEAATFDFKVFSLPTGDPAGWETNWGNFLITAAQDPSQILHIPSPLDQISLAQFVFKLNDQICRVSQNRVLAIGDVLGAGETRYYNYNSNDVTLLAYMKQGSVTVYYSLTTPNPSSAIYQDYFNASAIADPIPKSPTEDTGNVVVHRASPLALDNRAAATAPGIYVAVRGVGATNSYTLIGIAN